MLRKSESRTVFFLLVVALDPRLEGTKLRVDWVPFFFLAAGFAGAFLGAELRCGFHDERGHQKEYGAPRRGSSRFLRLRSFLFFFLIFVEQNNLVFVLVLISSNLLSSSPGSSFRFRGLRPCLCFGGPWSRSRPFGLGRWRIIAIKQHGVNFRLVCRFILAFALAIPSMLIRFGECTNEPSLCSS